MRKLLLTLMLASVVGGLYSCQDDDKLVTNAEAVTVSAGTSEMYTTPNSTKVKVWYKKENYSQIKTAGVLYGKTKDLDYLITYGGDENVAFTKVDTVSFDLYELDAATTYYYVGYAVLADGAVSYSGIRFFTTLDDDITLTPSFLTFDPVNASDLTSDTLVQDIVVKTLYDSWSVTFDSEVAPWIKSTRQIDDTTLRVVVRSVSDTEAAQNGRSSQIKLTATSGTVIKVRSALINQLPVTTTMNNPADYVYSYLAEGGYAGVGTLNVNIASVDAPSWVSVSRSSTGTIQVTAEKNTAITPRTGEVKITTALSNEVNVVKIAQVPGLTLTNETVVLGYAKGSKLVAGVTTYDGVVKLGSNIKENASTSFKDLFKILTPKDGGVSLEALADNDKLDTIRETLTVYYGDLSTVLNVYQAPTAFSIDKNYFEYPKAVASYKVTATPALTSATTTDSWLTVTSEGTVVTITTNSEATTEREGSVTLTWGEHSEIVTIKQLTVNDEPASNLTVSKAITIPSGEVDSISVDMEQVMTKFGLSTTAMDAYYIPSTSSDKGKFSTTGKSIIWRALNADNTPYLSAKGANQYTGDGYGSWFDADGNGSSSAEGVVCYSFNEETKMFNVKLSEAAEVGKTYKGTMEITYVQPATNDTNYVRYNISTTIAMPLLKEVTVAVASDEDMVVAKIDSLIAYAFNLDESAVAGKIADGSIEFNALNQDGSSVSTQTYTNGYIFDEDGNVGTYPNPVYVKYESSKLTLGLIDAAKLSDVTSKNVAVEFVYGDTKLPVTFTF